MGQVGDKAIDLLSMVNEASSIRMLDYEVERVKGHLYPCKTVARVQKAVKIVLANGGTIPVAPG